MHVAELIADAAQKGVVENRELNPAVRVVSFSGPSGGGKNFLIDLLQGLFVALSLMTSVTTRAKRGEGQDREYHIVSHEEFSGMIERDEFQWAEEKHGNWYGTTKAEIKRAVTGDFPRLTHVLHEIVEKLQDAVKAENDGRQGVFSFLVICDDEGTLRKRIEGRPGSMSSDELESRLAEVCSLQENWKESGLYHAVIVNNGDKSEEDLLREMMDHLSMPIPKPRCF